MVQAPASTEPCGRTTPASQSWADGGVQCSLSRKDAHGLPLGLTSQAL